MPASRPQATNSDTVSNARSLGQAPADHDAASVDDRPFATRLDELRHRRGLTFRALEALLASCAEPGERGMTNGHLASLTTGQRSPTPEAISLVARAFGLSPESFVEWRLWQLQQLFDPRRRDGLDAAVAAMYAVLERPEFETGDSPMSRESRRHARAALSTTR